MRRISRLPATCRALLQGPVSRARRRRVRSFATAISGGWQIQSGAMSSVRLPGAGPLSLRRWKLGTVSTKVQQQAWIPGD